MNPIVLGILVSFIVVSFFSNYTLISIYIKVVGSYALFSFIYSLIKKNTVSQKILIGTWEHPNNSCLILPFIWECDKAKKYVDEITKFYNIELEG